MTMKGVTLETKGNVSVDINTEPTTIDTEVPGKKIILP